MRSRSGPAPAERPVGTSLLPLVAALVTVVLWASAFVAIRHVGREFSPGALSLGRLLVGSLVLGALWALRDRVRPTRSDWPPIIVCGVVWFGVYNLALNEAERHLDAGVAAMLVNIGPILIAVLAGRLLKEGFPRRLVGGGAIAFVGVAVIASSASGGAHADAWGIALCLGAAASYAVGVVTQKPLLSRVPALTVTWLACVVGALVCMPFAPQLVHELRTAQPPTVMLVAYLGVFPTAVAFTTWAYALNTTTAGRMGATTYLVPPIAILLGWSLLGERPAPLALVGGALCLTGVYLTRRGVTFRRGAAPAEPGAAAPPRAAGSRN